MPGWECHYCLSLYDLYLTVVDCNLQVSQLGAAAQKYQAATQSASSNLSVPDLQNNCNMWVLYPHAQAMPGAFPFVFKLYFQFTHFFHFLFLIAHKLFLNNILSVILMLSLSLSLSLSLMLSAFLLALTLLSVAQIFASLYSKLTSFGYLWSEDNIWTLFLSILAGK